MSLRFALIASLLANVALGVVYLVRHPTRASMVAPMVARPGSASPAQIDDPLAGVDPRTWAHFASAGMPDLVAMLRAQGYPPEVVRAIVTVRVQERFAGRFHEIAEQIRAVPYWMWPVGREARAIGRAQDQLSHELFAAVVQALGSRVDASTETERIGYRGLYGNLSPEKLAHVLTLKNDYDEMHRQVDDDAHGVTLPEDREKLALLEREFRADLARILSPEELLAYDLRNSPTASRLRGDLSSFRPTEAEFRALYELRTQVDAQFPPRSAMSPEQKSAYAAALSNLDGQIAITLGPERYADYQRQIQDEWRENDDFVTRYHLPAETTPQLFAIQKEVQKRAAAIRSLGLPADQTNAQLAALADEANLRLTPLLGSAMLEGYRYRNPWLSGLAPKKREGGSSP